MKTLTLSFAVLILSLGTRALAESLPLSDSLDLKGTQWAASSQVSKKPKAVTASSTRNITLFEDSKTWLQFYTGYDYSFMADFANGTDAWVNAARASGYLPTGGGNHSGLLASTLLGFRLDSQDALALDLGSVLNFGNNWSISQGGSTLSQHLGAVLLSASLDYIRDLAVTPTRRTYLTLGAGFYHAIADYNLQQDTSYIRSSFSGNILGVTLGVGNEFSLGNGFGLDISVLGRYANFARVSSDTLSTDLGTPNPGPYSLAIATSSSYQTIQASTNSFIDSNPSVARYASLDFSGIDAKVALDFYF